MSDLEDYREWAEATSTAFTLTPVKAEIRVDSRILAMHLGNQHRTVMALVDKYVDRLSASGKVRFEIAPFKGSKTAQKERFALLNENQAYLLLALCRNIGRVVDLKVKLVQAFSVARTAAIQKSEEYLPTYRELHDVVHSLASGASNEKFVHMNVNKLVNKVVGIEAGQRAGMSIPKQSMLILAQALATNAMKGAVDHRDGYKRARHSLQALAAVTKIESLS